MLPHDFPKWQLVYYYFNKWKRDENIAFIQEALAERVSVKAGRKEEPTAAVIDSQLVKSTLVTLENTGIDAAKKIKGQKRHIIVDTSGLVLCFIIQSASVQDRLGSLEVIEKLTECWKKIVKLFADGGYMGKLMEAVKGGFSIDIEIIKKQRKTILRCYLNVGLWKEPLPGWTPIGELPKTMSALAIPVKQSFIGPLYEFMLNHF